MTRHAALRVFEEDANLEKFQAWADQDRLRAAGTRMGPIREHNASVIDPPQIAGTKATIIQLQREKDGAQLDWETRWVQEQQWAFKQQMIAEQEPVRIWYLKSRRVGTTSLFAMDDTFDMYNRPNRKVAICSHTMERSQEILAMCKFFLAHMNPRLHRQYERNYLNGIKLADNNSRINIGVCTEPQKIRGDGCHKLHLSEAAWYLNWFTVIMNECATVVAPEPGTEIIIETTGKTRGSPAHQHWDASKRGETVYRCLFLPWQADPTAIIRFASNFERDQWLTELQRAEPEMFTKFIHHKISAEAMHWGYRQFLFRCNSDYNYWCREYPMTEQEAWDTEGESFFGDTELSIADGLCVDNSYTLFQFNGLYADKVFTDFNELQVIDKTQFKDKFDRQHLYFKVWKWPQPGRSYVVASDSSMGTPDGDYSAGYVIDMVSREMMCSFHGKISNIEHARVLVSLGRIYKGNQGEALCSPEYNPMGGGNLVIDYMRRFGYHNIYVWRIKDSTQGHQLTQRVGFMTNRVTRRPLLSQIRGLLHDIVHGRTVDTGVFKDQQFLDEARSFQRGEEGEYCAIPGMYDDRIFGLGIAHFMASDALYLTSQDTYALHGKLDLEMDDPFKEQFLLDELRNSGVEPDEMIEKLFESKFNMSEEGEISWHE